MSKARALMANRVDALMERASVALVARDYFEAERLALEALELAHQAGDYERMSRIVLPLQEARRHKRQIASTSGERFVIDDQLPRPQGLRAGCYLVRPPRVGLDGRMLREMADKCQVPIIVVTREPMTRQNLWPIVALGPVTVRTQVEPPEAPPPPPPPAPPAAHAARKRPAAKPGPVSPPTPEPTPADRDQILPDVEWFLRASEALGDAALDSIDPARSLPGRIEDLLLRLQAHPDHELLHQALGAACAEAARTGATARRARRAEDELDAEVEADEAEQARLAAPGDEGRPGPPARPHGQAGGRGRSRNANAGQERDEALD